MYVEAHVLDEGGNHSEFNIIRVVRLVTDTVARRE